EPTPPKPEPTVAARATPVSPEPPDATRKSAESAARPQEEAPKSAPEPQRTADAAATSKAEEARVATPGSRPQVDIRSALRGGGGGPAGSSTGHLGGRGGIDGVPIPLDSKDPRYTDFLDRVRRAIYAKWGYPCVKSAVTRECEYKSAQLIIEFG